MATIAFVDGSSFEPASGEVRRHAVVVRLEPQPAAVLAMLAARPGELVRHDEMRQAVWGEGTHVNFQEGLHYAIRQIRITFEDNARAPWLIETIPRRGYRLRASAVLPSASATPPSATRWRTPAMLTAGTVALVAAVMFLERRPNNHHAVAVAVVRSVHGWLF